MSTYLYLECQNHQPPLLSEDEVGQHLYDLPRIRDEIAKREAFVAAESLSTVIPPHYHHQWTNTAARFFTQHPKCAIGIRDEYGREHPIELEDQP